MTGCPGCGNAESGSALARSTATCHCSSCRRPIRCPNPFSAASACTSAEGRARPPRSPRRTAPSPATRPAAARSGPVSATARGRQRAAGAAVPCASRTYDATGPCGAPPAERTRSRRTPGGPSPACPGGRAPSPGRPAGRRGVRRRGRRSAARVRAAGGWTSRRRSGLLQDETEHALDHGAQADPRESGEPTSQLGVEEPRRHHAYLPQTRQVLGGRVQHPLDAGDGLTEPGQVGAGDGVDQRGARALTAQLHEIGALSVAVAGRALGVDGEGARAGGEGRDRLGEGLLVGDHGRNALSGLEQRDRRRFDVVRRGASGGSQ